MLLSTRREAKRRPHNAALIASEKALNTRWPIVGSHRSRQLRTANVIDHRAGIGRLLIAAPGDVSVRSHQNQRTFIEGADSGIGDVHDTQRHVPFAKSPLQPGGMRGVRAKSQQHKTFPEQIDG